MGAIILFAHEECNFSFEFYEGVGFSLFKAQCMARENMRSGIWGDHWKQMIEKYPEGTATIKNAICYCKNCGKYYTEPQVVFYIPKEGYHYKYDERHSDMVPQNIIRENYEILEEETMICPDCEGISYVIASNNFTCPKCGKLINGHDIGNWD